MDSYAQGEAAPALLEETIGANLARTVASYADREALVECASGRRWTWAELDRDVDVVARGLIGAGIEKGDRVGIWGPNSAEWTLVQLATAKVGAILVNVNPSYRTHEFAYVVNQSGMRMLVSATSFKTSDYRAHDRGDGRPERRPRAGRPPRRRAQLGRPAGRRRRASPTTTCAPARRRSTRTTRSTSSTPRARPASRRARPSATATSSTTATSSARPAATPRQDRVCIPVPFYHCFGMVMGNLACTTHGATMVIPAPGFDPALTLRAVSDERCTSLYGVPTMFIAEWALPDLASYDLGSVRTGIMAGSPCPEEMMKKLIDAGIDEMTIGYGMTETSPVSTQTRTDDSLERKVGTVGRVAPHLEVKIVDPVSGDTLPRGEAGEFCTRGYSVMLGYWDDEEKTAEAIDADGWMHTGDLGVMDDDGYVRITGRIKDMVIRGGENIYPREIEEFLYTHPDIEDVQVVGVPDAKYGEELCAWLRMRAGHRAARRGARAGVRRRAGSRTTRSRAT